MDRGGEKVDETTRQPVHGETTEEIDSTIRLNQNFTNKDTSKGIEKEKEVVQRKVVSMKVVEKGREDAFSGVLALKVFEKSMKAN